MKTLEEIKNEVAIEYSYESYDDFKNLTRKIKIDNEIIMDEFYNKVEKRYAKEVAKKKKKKASENAKIDILSAESKCVVAIDKSSITNKENIVL